MGNNCYSALMKCQKYVPICPNMSQSDISFITCNSYSALMKYQIVVIFWPFLTLLVPAIISHSNISFFTYNSYSALMNTKNMSQYVPICPNQTSPTSPTIVTQP